VRSGYAMLVVLPPMAHEQLDGMIGRLTSMIPAEELLVATQNGVAAGAFAPLQMVEIPSTRIGWTLTAADYANASELAHKHDARSVLVVGPEGGGLSADALRALALPAASGSVDLALPYYDIPASAGLMNSAILYPVTRALYATRPRFPLSIDLGLSRRMVERMGAAAQRLCAQGQNGAMMWPAGEAVVSGFTLGEYDVGTRALPQPPDPDIRTILAEVVSSLFADVEAKAAFWQRPRRLPPPRAISPRQAAPVDRSSEVTSMVDGFRLAYTNLQEIWSLVLPPASLLGLKRLTVLEPHAFRMPENLWARIVYDFLIAYRMRTINRGHLLGALIPLYLAWVAGHINVTNAGTDAERHVEAVAAAFDAEKPYLVSRWRWPDRFNP
jgi:glucosylglycerate synthase